MARPGARGERGDGDASPKPLSSEASDAAAAKAKAVADNGGHASVGLRVGAVVAGGVATGIANACTQYLYPLLATETYGMSKSGLGRLLSFRNATILLGVLLLQPLARRMGAHLSVAVACLGVALPFALFGTVPTPAFVACVGIEGAVMAVTYVRLNGLTQTTGAAPSSQASVNTAYRAVQVIAPLLVTSFGLVGAKVKHPDHTIGEVVHDGHDHDEMTARFVRVCVCAGALFLAVAALFLYVAFVEAGPGGKLIPAAAAAASGNKSTGDDGAKGGKKKAGAMADALQSLSKEYGPVVRNSDLMAFLSSYMAIVSLNEIVTAFAVLRITQPDELAAPMTIFAAAASMSSIAAFGAVLVVGAVLDRFMTLQHVMVCIVAIKACAIATIGLTESPTVACVAYVVHRAVSHSANAPMSMWIARAVRARVASIKDHPEPLALGAPQSVIEMTAAAFVMNKVIGSVLKVCADGVLAVLVSHISLQTLFLLCALLLVPAGGRLAMLRAPVDDSGGV